jgi:hypothetical protein
MQKDLIFNQFNDIEKSIKLLQASVKKYVSTLFQPPLVILFDLYYNNIIEIH